eukprot:TRINITY_DN103176_c0_g1_i1.p1 TRINITY_DN103176_c0_g1~~TRINITY_DN103176_c0_g1_i1.p1  ORF type:complete len:223 (+),score=35.23 TRINITY_DN103176_c0_g1_i1:86-754(+)
MRVRVWLVCGLIAHVKTSESAFDYDDDDDVPADVPHLLNQSERLRDKLHQMRHKLDHKENELEDLRDKLDDAKSKLHMQQGRLKELELESEQEKQEIWILNLLTGSAFALLLGALLLHRCRSLSLSCTCLRCYRCCCCCCPARRRDRTSSCDSSLDSAGPDALGFSGRLSQRGWKDVFSAQVPLLKNASFGAARPQSQCSNSDDLNHSMSGRWSRRSPRGLV